MQFPHDFKMICWDVLLHSQRHFDSFACDSCQFPWSTPHVVKTWEKAIFLDSLEGGGASQDSLKRCKNRKKQKATQKSRLFGRGGFQPRLSEHCFSLVFPRFFGFWQLSATCNFLYTGRSVSSWVQACRNQSFNHCSYEHIGSEDQDCVFHLFWNLRPYPR